MNETLTAPKHYKPSNPQNEFTTEAEAEEYLKLWDRDFVRVDPVTKEPHESNKEFFWRVIHIFPAWKGSGDEKAFVAQVLAQKYYRHKTYKVSSDPTKNDPANRRSGDGGRTMNEAYHGRNSHGDIIDTGQWSDDAKKFKQQFVEDKTD